MRPNYIPTFYRYKSGELYHYFSFLFIFCFCFCFCFGIICKMWNMSVLLGSDGGESARALAVKESELLAHHRRHRWPFLWSVSRARPCGHRPAHCMKRPGQLTTHSTYRMSAASLWDFRYSRRRVWWWLPSRLLSRAIALMMESASTSETLANFYKTTRRYNPEHSHLQGVSARSIKYKLYSTVFLG
jgi:hypothetical protein